jgi:hypothetical protein
VMRDGEINLLLRNNVVVHLKKFSLFFLENCLCSAELQNIFTSNMLRF